MSNQIDRNLQRLAYTIFADVGVAPWAWVKPAVDQTCYVGGNCADSSGWYADGKITEQLESDFVNWAIFYNSQPWFTDEYCHQTFDWVGFNNEGMELATRLKNELGDSALVYYARPCEEPNILDKRVEIKANN